MSRKKPINQFTEIDQLPHMSINVEKVLRKAEQEKLYTGDNFRCADNRVAYIADSENILIVMRKGFIKLKVKDVQTFCEELMAYAEDFTDFKRMEIVPTYEV